MYQSSLTKYLRTSMGERAIIRKVADNVNQLREIGYQETSNVHQVLDIVDHVFDTITCYLISLTIFLKSLTRKLQECPEGTSYR